MENKNNAETFSLWKSTSVNVLQQTLQQNALVTIILPGGYDGRSERVQLAGRFADIKDNVARFICETRDGQAVDKKFAGKRSPGSLISEIFFNVMQPDGADGEEPVGYSSQGDILQIELDPDGGPREIMLRVYRRFNTRRLRRDPRLRWEEGMQALVGLDIVNEPPADRTSLRFLLEETFRGADNKAGLINISAGGACLCVERQMATRGLNAHELYLFLFSPEPPKKNQLPYIFLCKKSGMLKGICQEERIALRLQFLQELDWALSQTTLQWNDIESTGSEAMRLLVDETLRHAELRANASP